MYNFIYVWVPGIPCCFVPHKPKYWSPIYVLVVAQLCLTLCDPMDLVAHQAFLFFTISSSLHNSCPLSQWWHPTVSPSVVHFPSCPQSFPTPGSFPAVLSAGGGGDKDEVVGWHHGLNGHEFEQTTGDRERQGSLLWYSQWGSKELDTTERLNNNNKRLSKGWTTTTKTMLSVCHTYAQHSSLCFIGVNSSTITGTLWIKSCCYLYRSVFSKETEYIYIHTHTYIYMCMYACMYVCM